MEGEERDPERQMDIGRRNRQSERRQQTGQIGGDEIRVFEDPEDQKISRHRDRQRHFAGGTLPIINGQGGKEVEDDREQKNDDELRLSPGIEHQGEHKSNEVFSPDRRGDEIESQKDRQEVEQEGYRRKNHYRNACAQPVRILRQRLPQKTRDGSVRRGASRTPNNGGAAPGTSSRDDALARPSLRRFGGDVQAMWPALNSLSIGDEGAERWSSGLIRSASEGVITVLDRYTNRRIDHRR